MNSPLRRPIHQHVKPPSFRQTRRIGLISAVPVAILGLIVLLGGAGETLIAHGPIQSGHAALACAECHLPAPGSTRQQVQANFRYLIGLRETPVDFGYAKVGSAACLGCHRRPNERHPIYRFREPRFQKAKDVVDATTCLGCHNEHTDSRVAAEPTFCQACHDTLKLKIDPLDIPHETLIANKDWTSCLGCHDFHGNHKAPAPLRRIEAHQLDALLAYLKNGADPYAPVKIYEASYK
jgi:hypothetical protein